MPWLGERLKRAREWRGLTGEQLAERVGISVSYISELEHNRNNPSLELLQRLGEALDVSPCWLIDPGILSPLDFESFLVRLDHADPVTTHRRPPCTDDNSIPPANIACSVPGVHSSFCPGNRGVSAPSLPVPMPMGVFLARRKKPAR